MTQMLAQREHDYFAETVICANCYIVALFFLRQKPFFLRKQPIFLRQKTKKAYSTKTPAEKLNCSHGNFKLSPRLHRRLYAALSRFHAASYFFCALPASVHKIRTALESRPCQKCGIPAGNRTQISSLGNCCSIH